MLLPSQKILHSLRRELARLQHAGSVLGEGSALQALAAVAGLLAAREAGGPAKIQAQFGRLAERLAALENLLPKASLQTAAAGLRSLIAEAQSETNLAALEAAWVSALQQMEALATQLAASTEIPLSARTQAALEISAWEIADLQSQLASDAVAAAAEGSNSDLSAERVQQYLARRFADPGLQLTEFKALAGGFGKQTFLFAAQGEKLSGEFVLRRDAVDALIPNDCHCIDKEYALIQAVYAEGFPAPEALWLDLEHPEIPGGHFLVMRRAPGVPGGSVFQASSGVPPQLAQTLASIMARLHQLPPLRALGALTESIHPELWDMPLQTCVRRYLENWAALFAQEQHIPSPALAGYLAWLLAHVPAASGRPALLHGDIGFHNFLFADGELTAVLDWEFAHIGDPAEDLAYIRNTLGGSLDWDAFMAYYLAAGGASVSAERLWFFQIWGQVRNACAANLVASKLAYGRVDDLKLALLPHIYIPQFLAAAQSLIERGP